MPFLQTNMNKGFSWIRRGSDYPISPIHIDPERLPQTACILAEHQARREVIESLVEEEPSRKPASPKLQITFTFRNPTIESRLSASDSNEHQSTSLDAPVVTEPSSTILLNRPSLPRLSILTRGKSFDRSLLSAKSADPLNEYRSLSPFGRKQPESPKSLFSQKCADSAPIPTRSATDPNLSPPSKFSEQQEAEPLTESAKVKKEYESRHTSTSPNKMRIPVLNLKPKASWSILQRRNKKEVALATSLPKASSLTSKRISRRHKKGTESGNSHWSTSTWISRSLHHRPSSIAPTCTSDMFTHGMSPEPSLFSVGSCDLFDTRPSAWDAELRCESFLQSSALSVLSFSSSDSWRSRLSVPFDDTKPTPEFTSCVSDSSSSAPSEICRTPLELEGPELWKHRKSDSTTKILIFSKDDDDDEETPCNVATSTTEVDNSNPLYFPTNTVYSDPESMDQSNWNDSLSISTEIDDPDMSPDAHALIRSTSDMFADLLLPIES